MSRRVEIFISSVSGEFPGYREALEKGLKLAGEVGVNIQRDMRSTSDDALTEVIPVIEASDMVVHLVGERTGSVPYDKPAGKKAVQALLARLPRPPREHPHLKALLEENKASLSYTQWEAYLAVYFGKKLLVARPARKGRSQVDEAQRQSQEAHLARLNGLGREAFSFAGKGDLAKQVRNSRALQDLQSGSTADRVARLREMALGEDEVRELRSLLVVRDNKLRKEHFVCLASTQIWGSFGADRVDNQDVDLLAFDRLAASDPKQQAIRGERLLILAHLCMKRADAILDAALNRSLKAWFDKCRPKCVENDDQVTGHPTYAKVHSYLEQSFVRRGTKPLPAPTLEVTWAPSYLDPAKVYPEVKIRWGRCLADMDTGPNGVPVDEVLSVVSETWQKGTLYARLPSLGRIDVFVAKDDLNRQLEYRAQCGPEAAVPAFHPWPTVLRRRDREGIWRKRPPSRVEAARVAQVTDSDGLEWSANERQIFFVGADAPVDVDLVQRLSGYAGLGIWLRTPNPSGHQILTDLDGCLLHALPTKVHECREESPRGDPWRVASVLFDHKDLPEPEFHYPRSAEPRDSSSIDAQIDKANRL